MSRSPASRRSRGAGRATSTLRLPRPGARSVRVVLLGMAAAHVAEAIWLRSRRNHLERLETLPRPAGPDDLPVRAVTAAGVVVGPSTLRGAQAFLRANRLDTVDLVPGDLPARRALRFLRRVDPGPPTTPTTATPATSVKLTAPGGANQAIAATASLIDRLDARDTIGADTCRPRPSGTLDTDHLDELEPESMVIATLALQRGAITSHGHALAPELTAGHYDGSRRWAELDQLCAFTKPYLSLAPLLLGLEGAHLAAMAAGAILDPVGGGLALATWCAQPAIVFGGDRFSFRPPDVVRASFFRWLDSSAEWGAAVAAAFSASRAAGAARRALSVPGAFVAPDPAEMFEPRRDDCAWCGSVRLETRVVTPDLLQHKAGEFRLDECSDCGHIFQNPRLSIAGLDHYYDQFYDGIGGEASDAAFSRAGFQYRARIETVARHTEPSAWLDVGAGYGHFCLTARQRWTDTVFDGLDLSDGIDLAARRGWVDTGYRGLFPEMAEGLPHGYDVVSMHHYLEHTREPKSELDAAAKVLEPGGYLLIELPDAESRWSRILGRYYPPWFQPQHQHFIPLANLEWALRERNFEILTVERGAANQPTDLATAFGLWLEHKVPTPHMPWSEPVPLAHRMLRPVAFLVAAPFLAASSGLDQILHQLRPADSVANTYRVLARKI